MFKKHLIPIILIVNILAIDAQDITSFLKQVSENDPEILAYKKLLEARRIEARTGLNPSDPFISFGYMPGNSEAIGSKKIWSVNQSFSFPTRYLLQRKISRSTIILAEQEFNLGKLLIMLDAELTLFDLIYFEKTLIVLNKRKEGYDNLQKAWKKIVDAGEATIINYNKVMMELSTVNLQINNTSAEISMLRSKLRFMTGSNYTLPELTDYPVIQEFDPQTLIREKTTNHPAFVIPEKELQISLEEVKLSKTGSLPEFQVGYSSEIVPGEKYTGPVAGLSIPLWSNSNRVRTASAMADHSAASRDAVQSRLKSEVLNEYSNMEALKKSMNEITSILESGDNRKYLESALNNGEISLTTYFSDLGVMFELEDKLLELEREYKKSNARLNDHKLIGLDF